VERTKWQLNEWMNANWLPILIIFFLFVFLSSNVLPSTFFGTTLPSVNFISLNSTNITVNDTFQDLTLYYNVSDMEGDQIKNIVTWFRDGRSASVLHLPFENMTDSNYIFDYSFNNFTNWTNAIWNSTGGYDGKGALEFDGTNKFVDTTLDVNDNLGEGFSLVAWVKHNDYNSYFSWVFGSANNGFFQFGKFSGTGEPFFEVGMNNGSLGKGKLRARDANLADGNWHHIVATWNRSEQRIYFDGILNVSKEAVDEINNSYRQLFVGRNVFGEYWNGSIDDVIVFNYSISAEQVWEFYQENYSVIKNADTITNQVWKACVTPHDKTGNGSIQCSENITILPSRNFKPNITSILLNSTLPTNDTSQNLSILTETFDANGDNVTLNNLWYLNGSLLTTLVMSFEKINDTPYNNAYDYTPLANQGLNYGSSWNESIGYGGSGAYSFNASNSSHIALTNSVDLVGKTIIMRIKNSTGWYQIVNASGTTYINGILAETSIPFNGSSIGVYSNQSFFNDVIDDIIIFNRTLSASQILSIYVDGSNLMLGDETTIGDTWHTCVIPNDGKIDGSERCTNSITIYNLDLIKPKVFDLIPLNGTSFELGFIEIAANITDTSLIDNVWVNITFPNGSYQIINLTFANGTNLTANLNNAKYNFSFSLPPLIGAYHANFSARDISGNINSTESTFFVGVDNILPNVYDPFPSEAFVVRPNSIDLTINVLDNSLVDNVSANITLPDNTSVFKYLALVSDNQYSVDLSAETLLDGFYYVNYYANDTYGNRNDTTTTYFQVDSNVSFVTFHPPTPSHGTTQKKRDFFVNFTTNDVENHYAFVDIGNDVLLWMRFEDNNLSGNKTFGGSYHKNNGSFVNGTTIIPNGRFGQGIELDGVDDNLFIPKSNKFSFSNKSVGYSFSVWIKPDNADNSGVSKQIIQTMDTNLTNNGRNIIGIDYSGSCTTGVDVIKTNVGNAQHPDKLGEFICSNISVVADEWLHIVMTVNNSAGGDSMIKIYGNTMYGGSGQIDDETNDFQDIIIGSNKYYTRFFKGIIDELLIFNRTLTKIEVDALYNLTYQRFEYNFSDLADKDYPVTTHTVDKVGNSNHTETRTITIDNTPPIFFSVIPSKNNTYYVYEPIAIGGDIVEQLTSIDYNFGAIFYPNGTSYNFTYHGSHGNIYFHNLTTPFLLGRYNVTFFSNDTNKNANDYNFTWFWVLDTISPTVKINELDLNGSNNNPNVSQTIQFSVNASDDFNLSSVWVNVSMPNGSNVVINLTLTSSNEITATIKDQFTGNYTIPEMIRQYNLTFITKDNNNNTNYTFSFFTAYDYVSPVIQQFTKSPKINLENKSVLLSLNKTDNVEIDKEWANITFPNNHSIIANLPYELNQTNLTGNYSVIFFTNDTSNNVVNTSTQFVVYPPMNAQVHIPNLSTTISTFLTVYFSGTQEEINCSARDRYFNLTLPQRLVDLVFISSFNGSNNFTTTIFGINLNQFGDESFLVTNPSNLISGGNFLSVFAINTSYNFSSAQIVFDYSDLNFEDERYLTFNKCDDFDLNVSSCTSGFYEITPQASQDLGANTFTFTTSSFSAFGILQGEIPVVASSSGGGGGGSGCAPGRVLVEGRCVKELIVDSFDEIQEPPKSIVNETRKPKQKIEVVGDDDLPLFGFAISEETKIKAKNSAPLFFALVLVVLILLAYFELYRERKGLTRHWYGLKRKIIPGSYCPLDKPQITKDHNKDSVWCRIKRKIPSSSLPFTKGRTLKKVKDRSKRKMELLTLPFMRRRANLKQKSNNLRKKF
jgi:hypothetical protein